MTSKTRKYDVVIVGAGAAGLFCAFTAARRGLSVLVLDHANKVGKKILMSGGGRCNFTNLEISAENYICSNPHFVKSALARYTQWDFIELVSNHGIEYFEKENGQLFCVESSKQIRDMLLAECQKAGVRIETHRAVTQIVWAEHYVLDVAEVDHRRRPVATKTAEQISCSHLVIATGGLSIPTMGASDFGYQVATQFGHSIVPTAPALTPLILEPQLLEHSRKLAGNSIAVSIGNARATFTGPLLFTHKGISGPPVLQISSYWQPGETLQIDWSPARSIRDFIIDEQQGHPDALLKTALSRLFTQRFAEFCCQHLLQTMLANAQQIKLKQLTPRQINKVANHLHNWCFTPAGYEGYRVAEVTRGGIHVDEVSSKTFESKLQPNLYFIGEVLDVTGHLGGYNFQWAWASAHAAGCAIPKPSSS